MKWKSSARFRGERRTGVREAGLRFKGVGSPACYRLSRNTEALDVVSLQNRCDMSFLSSTLCPNFLDLVLPKIETIVSHVCTMLCVQRPWSWLGVSHRHLTVSWWHGQTSGMPVQAFLSQARCVWKSLYYPDLSSLPHTNLPLCLAVTRWRGSFTTVISKSKCSCLGATTKKKSTSCWLPTACRQTWATTGRRSTLGNILNLRHISRNG